MLIVHDLMPSDAAHYMCSASSDEDLGTHEMTASITVHCELSLVSFVFITKKVQWLMIMCLQALYSDLCLVFLHRKII